MNTPDREAKSLQHYTTESTDPVNGRRVVLHVYAPDGSGAVAAPAGKNIVDAFAKGIPWFEAKFPGYTL